MYFFSEVTEQPRETPRPRICWVPPRGWQSLGAPIRENGLLRGSGCEQGSEVEIHAAPTDKAQNVHEG